MAVNFGSIVRDVEGGFAKALCDACGVDINLVDELGIFMRHGELGVIEFRLWLNSEKLDTISKKFCFSATEMA